MPHSTSPPLQLRRERSLSHATAPKPVAEARMSMEKFPDMDPSFLGEQDDILPEPPRTNGALNGVMPSPFERWQTRREPIPPSWTGKAAYHPTGRVHGRQKSLTDAFRTIRSRKGSVTANAHEIAGALKAPVSPKLITLCIIWYLSSALTNTSSKTILMAFPKPATLTLIQFGFVSSYCLLFSALADSFPAMKNAIPALRFGIRPPTRDVIVTTLPLAFFQIGGHLLSSSATQRIPVSLVHTIKGLSPLFTVFAYRIVFDIRYPLTTYLSLIPLTLGVMLACSASFKGNFIGILYAFLAAIIFVTQNIFSKRLFNEAAKAEADGLHQQSRRLDKLNLLCYSSGLAFLLTAPLWLFSEGFALISDFLHDGSLDLENTTSPASLDHGRLTLEFIFNGTFHFGQNIIAFVLLSMVSPVTYSVASLIKRVFVVVIAIIWFQNATTPIQGFGIALTFFGLYLYDRTGQSNKADRKARLLDIKEEALLPIRELSGDVETAAAEEPQSVSSASNPYLNGYNGPPEGNRLRSDSESIRGRPGGAVPPWIPPVTRPEDRWPRQDVKAS
ncbi:hypothetical protein V500_08105 [Pseudogymnoascus sp. VKM F-4518 (FW-2643)]|nr:hypothetical protein V500_08105 [Pseudogymnoascus sp. VKM F-4518 (FW-2643)]